MKVLFLSLAIFAVCSAHSIISEGGVVTFRDGSPGVLTCKVTNIEYGGIIWKKNDEIIAVDEEMLDTSESYEVHYADSATILTIRRTEPIFSGNYSCQLGADEVMEDKIVFSVNVQVKPLVQIRPDILDVRVGEKNIVFTCNVKEGNPTPTLAWTKQGASWPSDARIEQENKRVVIPVVTKSHAGIYQCKAENAAGTHTTNVELHVSDASKSYTEEKPWVKMEDKVIPLSKHQDISLSCTYDGTPVPQVEWLFNGYKIQFHDDKFKRVLETAQRFDGYSKSTLRIPAIPEDAFGDYACRVSNKLGSVSAVVHASGKPGPPELSLDGSELTWTVRSIDSVKEYEICQRFSYADQFLPENCSSVRVKKADNDGGDKWTHTIDLLSYLEPGLKYDIQIRGRNSLGWGSLASEPLAVQLGGSKKDAVKSASMTSIFSAFIMTIFTVLYF